MGVFFLCVPIFHPALLYHDWLVMLPTEIYEIWLKKPTLASVLYLSARYFGILDWAMFLVVAFAPGSENVGF